MLLVVSAAEELTCQQPTKQRQISFFFLVKSQRLTCKLLSAFICLSKRGVVFFLIFALGASFIKILCVKKMIHKHIKAALAKKHQQELVFFSK